MRPRLPLDLVARLGRLAPRRVRVGLERERRAVEDDVDGLCARHRVAGHSLDELLDLPAVGPPVRGVPTVGRVVSAIAAGTATPAMSRTTTLPRNASSRSTSSPRTSAGARSRRPTSYHAGHDAKRSDEAPRSRSASRHLRLRQIFKAWRCSKAYTRMHRSECVPARRNGNLWEGSRA